MNATKKQIIKKSEKFWDFLQKEFKPLINNNKTCIEIAKNKFMDFSDMSTLNSLVAEKILEKRKTKICLCKKNILTSLE